MEHQSERDGAALADYGNATRDRRPDYLIGPERDAIEEIDEAIAVGAEKRHRAGAFYQIASELIALRRSRLGEPGRKTHKAAGIALAQGGGDSGHVTTGRRYKSCIGSAGKLLDRAVVGRIAG